MITKYLSVCLLQGQPELFSSQFQLEVYAECHVYQTGHEITSYIVFGKGDIHKIFINLSQGQPRVF